MTVIIMNVVTGNKKVCKYLFRSQYLTERNVHKDSFNNTQEIFSVIDESEENKVCAIYFNGQNILA